MKKTKSKKKNKWYILFFCILPVAHLIIFTYLPFIQNIINSFFSMSYTSVDGFVGFQNYEEVLSKPEFWDAFRVLIYYIISAVVQTFLALGLALLLVKNKRFYNFFKSSIFLPYLINAIAIGFIFRLFFTRGFIFDSILGFIGLDKGGLPFWLRDQSINNIVLSFISLWRYTGFNMIIFIGALVSIDKNQYDAAYIDGAGKWRTFRYVTFPNIKKLFFAVLTLSVISSFNEFDIPFAVSSGGSNNTATFMIYIFRMANISHKVGMASAMIVLISLFILLAFVFLFLIRSIYKKLKKGVRNA